MKRINEKRSEYEQRALEEATRYLNEPSSYDPTAGMVYAMLAVNETLKELRMTLVNGIKVVNK